MPSHSVLTRYVRCSTFIPTRNRLDQRPVMSLIILAAVVPRCGCVVGGTRCHTPRWKAPHVLYSIICKTYCGGVYCRQIGGIGLRGCRSVYTGSLPIGQLALLPSSTSEKSTIMTINVLSLLSCFQFCPLAC